MSIIHSDEKNEVYQGDRRFAMDEMLATGDVYVDCPAGQRGTASA